MKTPTAASVKPADRPITPYERIGGRAPIARLVHRFYDLMDGDPAYAELRAMHAADLGPIRDSLIDFLVAWSGGPRDWFDKRPGACMMSYHRGLDGMNLIVARQWVTAMQVAANDTIVDHELAANMMEAFARMAAGMARVD